jgi:hypothetical protein
LHEERPTKKRTSSSCWRYTIFSVWSGARFRATNPRFSFLQQ